MKTVGAPVTYFETMVCNYYGKSAAVARVERDHGRRQCTA